MKINIDKLIAQVDNSDHDSEVIEDSKRKIQNGESRPILVSSEDGHVIDGNHTLKAYQELGIQPEQVYQGTSKDFYSVASESNYDGLEMIYNMIEKGTATLVESLKTESIKLDEKKKEDKSKSGHKTIVLDINDSYGDIEDLLNYISKTANLGHSFSIVVDPTYEEFRKEFSIDGDGWDRITIKSVEFIEDNDTDTKKKKEESVIHELGDFQNKDTEGPKQDNEQKIIEISTDTIGNNKISKMEIKSFEDFVKLYKGIIDIKFNQSYPGINKDEDKDLWQDTANELYLKSRNFIIK